MDDYWKAILKERYATYKVEERAFSDSLKICHSNDVSAEKIYDAIKDDNDVPTNLKAMYRDAIFGTDRR